LGAVCRVEVKVMWKKKKKKKKKKVGLF